MIDSPSHHHQGLVTRTAPPPPTDGLDLSVAGADAARALDSHDDQARMEFLIRHRVAILPPADSQDQWTVSVLDESGALRLRSWAAALRDAIDAVHQAITRQGIRSREADTD